MTVKPIDREKIEEMLLIEQSCFEDEAWTKAMLCEGLECPGAVYLGAFEGDRLVGYLALLVSLDFADIATVGVVPEFQRRGIGKALVETAVFYAARAKVGKIFLEVNEENLPAVSLYEKCGFKKEGVRKNYYDGMIITGAPVEQKNYYDTRRFSSRDALIMAKTL